MSYTRSAPMQPPPRGLGTALLAAADRAGLGLLIWTEREQEQSIQYANVIAGDLLGRAPHELIGRALAMLVAPSDLPTLRAASGAFAEQGRTVQVRLLRPDHSHVTASIAVGHGHLGERPALVGLLFETARRHRAEQALRTSELLYRRVIDAAPEPIIIVGGGEIVYANAAALELSGFDRLEQMRAAGVPGTTDSRDLPWAVHDSQPISHAGVDSVVELRLRRAGGDTVNVEVVSVPTEWGGAPAVLHIGRELSARRRHQVQLIQADRLTAVGTLAAGVAHEINNPLAYVLLNLQYLLRELPRLHAEDTRLDQLQQRLQEAKHGAERVRSIVRDLRQFSSTEEHEQLGPVDLRRVLQAAIKVAASQLQARARVVEDYQEIPPVLGNAAKLEQVFLNLLINAAQAVPRGQPAHHQVRVAASCEGPERVLVEVSDTGAGIAPELLNRVFDPFFTTKPAGVGTGLGLPICHNIIGSLGGEISVDSQLGRGTVFRVLLRPHTRMPAMRVPTPQPLRAVRGAPASRARVLVVDDELPVAAMLSRVLAEEYDVEVTTQGEDALELLLGPVSFDVVICDLLMPEMSGMDLFKELQARRPGLERRFVFMTGGAFTPRAAEFLSQVDNPRIEKPFNLNQVRMLVRSVAQASIAKAGADPAAG